jgi:hypothetical protein
MNNVANNTILNAPDPMTPDEFESHLYQQAHDPRNLRRAQTAADTGDISSRKSAHQCLRWWMK